jgi:hypothetical protein
MTKIVRAAHLGMCFGVRDAIALAVEQGKAGPLTILGDLVHNPIVLADLEARGIAIARDLADVKTSSVMVTAHGASRRALQRTRALGLDVVEGTCPLVHAAHRAVALLVREGYHPVIIGQRTHVEVRGVTDDLDAFDVVLDDQDVMDLEEHPRIGIAAQTTQSMERVPSIGGPFHRYGLPADQTASGRRARAGARLRRGRGHRRRQQQQHAGARADVLPLLFPCPPCPDGAGPPSRMVRCRGQHHWHHGGDVYSGQRDRSRRRAHS